MSHWYDRDGNPHHFIEMANGKGTRDSTLRDARKHNWFPSVTGIIDVIAKPGLVKWFLSEQMKAAFGLPVITSEDAEDDAISQMLFEAYSAAVTKIATKKSNEARETGTEIHDSIEMIWNDEVPPKHYAIARSAVRVIINYCETEDFNPEITVVGDGYGGKIDLHNDDFLIDYKTKDIKDSDWDKYQAFREGSSKTAPRLHFPDMCMQLAAYDRAIPVLDGGLQDHYLNRRLVNVFVDREIPGRVIIHEWADDDVDEAFKKFMLLLKYWQLDKNYVPQR